MGDGGHPIPNELLRVLAQHFKQDHGISELHSKPVLLQLASCRSVLPKTILLLAAGQPVDGKPDPPKETYFPPSFEDSSIGLFGQRSLGSSNQTVFAWVI